MCSSRCSAMYHPLSFERSNLVRPGHSHRQVCVFSTIGFPVQPHTISCMHCPVDVQPALPISDSEPPLPSAAAPIQTFASIQMFFGQLARWSALKLEVCLHCLPLDQRPRHKSGHQHSTPSWPAALRPAASSRCLSMIRLFPFTSSSKVLLHQEFHASLSGSSPCCTRFLHGVAALGNGGSEVWR